MTDVDHYLNGVLCGCGCGEAAYQSFGRFLGGDREKYADIRHLPVAVNCKGGTQDEVATKIRARVFRELLPDSEKELKRMCEERGWSYPNTPAVLVERLFDTIAIRESTIAELRGELGRWDHDVREALGAHDRAGEDVTEIIRRLSVAPASDLASRIEMLSTVEKLRLAADLLEKENQRPPSTHRSRIQDLFRRFVDRKRGW